MILNSESPQQPTAALWNYDNSSASPTHSFTMTPTPPSTNSSTGGRSPEEQFRVVRKRNRVPLSCYPCRTRKYAVISVSAMDENARVLTSHVDCECQFARLNRRL